MLADHLFVIFIDKPTLNEDTLFIKNYVTKIDCLKVRTSDFNEQEWTTLLQTLKSNVKIVSLKLKLMFKVSACKLTINFFKLATFISLQP